MHSHWSWQLLKVYLNLYDIHVYLSALIYCLVLTEILSANTQFSREEWTAISSTEEFPSQGCKWETKTMNASYREHMMPCLWLGLSLEVFDRLRACIFQELKTWGRTWYTNTKWWEWINGLKKKEKQSQCILRFSPGGFNLDVITVQI